MLKKLTVICLMVSLFSFTFSPIADAASNKKTHIVNMAHLKKSAMFAKQTQIAETLAGPVSSKGQAVYASIINIAPGLIGTPYIFGGKTPAGFDCSGFIHYVHNLAGLPITRKSSEDYYKDAEKVLTPQAGDLVFFKDTYKTGISHMGIYVGNQQFIHAGSKGVEITKLDNAYWQKHFIGFKRFNSVTTK